MQPALLAGELVKKYDPQIFYAYIQRGFDGNEPKFVLWQDSISFYFDQYELATYFAGSQEITIPYSDPRNIVKAIYTDCVKLIV